jgi:hypothetical protein
MQRSISAVLLASAVSLSAFENLDFEEIPPPPDPWSVTVPGWTHISAIGGGANYWNVNMVNLSGWAEATVIYDADPPLPGTIWSPPALPLDGLFSMALSAGWPLLPSTNDLSAAWIGQTGTIAPAAPRLTLLTDYTGPRVWSDPENPGWDTVGYLTIYFDASPVDFTLADAGTGPEGQPLRQLSADLSPFAGQTAELRIGIEGPHNFLIDNIEFVPEPTSLAFLAACVGAVCIRYWLRSHTRRSAQAS